jgi:hypothetical protein
MKFYGILFWGWLSVMPILAMSGCATGQARLPIGEQSEGNMDYQQTGSPRLINQEAGAERTFTNANIVAWIPTRAKRIWDEMATSGAQIDEITTAGAFIKEYKISILIEVKTAQAFKFYAERFSEWDFQEHSELTMRDGKAGRQYRKDIRDPANDRVLRISVMVRKGATFGQDEVLAKRIVESIRLNSK